MRIQPGKFFLCAALAFASQSYATQPQTPVEVAPQPTSPAKAFSATEDRLQVFNRDVFVFRAPLLGFSSADRARRAKTRIHEQLEGSGANVVSLKADTLGLYVQVDGTTSFIVTQADVDGTHGETLDSVSKATVTALETVIAESRESRNLDLMLRASAMALAATIAALLLSRFASRIRDSLTRALRDLIQKHTERLKLGGFKLLDKDRVTAVVRMTLSGVNRVLLFTIFYYWLSYVLSRFPFTRPWGEALSGFLFGLASNMGGAIVRAVPGVMTALLIFFIARWVNQLLKQFFESARTGQIQVGWLDADVVTPTWRITSTLVWLFALAMAYPYLPGSDTEAFKGLSVVVGLMISLGASNLVGQAASGLILTYGRVFRRGEYVSIADYEGTVTEMGMFATRIRTGLGEELTIANSKILDSTTKNYSRAVKGAGFVLDTTVTIGYDTAWRQVQAMLVQAALRTEGVLEDPPPVVFQTALSDWYPEYRLVCQAVPTGPRPRALVLSNLHANIQDVFNEYGVQIMSPQYFEDPKDPKIVSPEKWYPAPAVKPSPEKS